MFRMSMKQFRKISAARKFRGGIVRQRCAVKGGPNQTEARFNSQVLCGRGAFHPASYTVSRTTSRRYTPDYSWEVNEVPVVIEVKGGYRLPSEQRARLAWELAAEANPGTVFVWARFCRGVWDVEAWYRGGRTTSRACVACMTDMRRLVEEVLA